MPTPSEDPEPTLIYVAGEEQPDPIEHEWLDGMPYWMYKQLGKPPPVSSEHPHHDIEEGDPLWVLDNDGDPSRALAAGPPRRIKWDGGMVWVVDLQDQRFPVPLVRVALRREKTS